MTAELHRDATALQEDRNNSARKHGNTKIKPNWQKLFFVNSLKEKFIIFS